MSRIEFAAVVAYLAAGCGKPLSADGAEAYYDLLGDLPLPALQVAAKQALLEGQYPVFPPVGVLRRLAADAIAGRDNVLSGAEAWGLVRKAMVAYGYNREREGLASLPPLVRKAAECMGWQSMCDSTNTETISAQFRKTFEAVAARDQRERLLPAELKQSLARICPSPELLPLPDQRNAWQVLRDAGLRLVGEKAVKIGSENGDDHP